MVGTTNKSMAAMCGEWLRRKVLQRLLQASYHREPEQLSSAMAHNQKCKQALECQGWNQAKIIRRYWRW